ncbi:MAG: ATP-binding protein [Mesorhizobium amorphae]|nr:MAG: ATP-binding protein [Mesorhizobium amorphae]
MNAHQKVNQSAGIGSRAPLRNVVNFSTVLETVVGRRQGLPGMACFFGPSGYGKSESAIASANFFRAAYVECGQFTGARSLMEKILRENGVTRPRGTIEDMKEEAGRIMAGDPRRPLIIDEAHHIANKRFINLVREIHDMSGAAIVLIGEETLPRQLEAFERVHNCMLEWCPALPCNAEDLAMLTRISFPNVSMSPDLAAALLDVTRGNTRRIVVNLAKIEEASNRLGLQTIGLKDFGGTDNLIGSSAPAARRL